MPFESLGGLHPTTSATITKIGKGLAAHSGKSEGEVVSHLFQRLGVLLAKGNAC